MERLERVVRDGAQRLRREHADAGRRLEVAAREASTELRATASECGQRIDGAGHDGVESVLTTYDACAEAMCSAAGHYAGIPNIRRSRGPRHQSVGRLEVHARVHPAHIGDDVAWTARTPADEHIDLVFVWEHTRDGLGGIETILAAELSPSAAIQAMAAVPESLFHLGAALSEMAGMDLQAKESAADAERWSGVVENTLGEMARRAVVNRGFGGAPADRAAFATREVVRLGMLKQTLNDMSESPPRDLGEARDELEGPVGEIVKDRPGLRPELPPSVKDALDYWQPERPPST
jgi:hypothetical protein